jgi:DNA-binding transcriptional ArsR family regulator
LVVKVACLVDAAALDQPGDRAILKFMLKYSTPLDGVFHALADPTRRAMVDRLGRGPATVSELAKPLSMTLSAVMQHLLVLEGAGLVRSAKVGRVRTCRLDEAMLASAEAWFAGRRAAWSRHLDALGDYLDATPDDSPEGDPHA